MAEARSALKQYFGYDEFRRGQVDVVASVLAGCDTLGVLPTGGGKSLCYQVPALVLPGLTVVISPLISLMKDQVDRLERLRIPATFLNSTLDPLDVSARLARARRGDLKLLYVAPERFEAADLTRCLEQCTLSLLAVDEAHCISEWGHEFRPSFRRIGTVRDRLGFPQTMALTATATPTVRADILRQLRLRHPRVVVSGFDRTNLSYAVRHCRNEGQRRDVLLRTLVEHAGPAIIYASTRSTVERVAKVVSRARIRTLPYHGGLDDQHRQEVQDAFMGGAVNCLVATNAFGMGIDKPDVRLVVHYTMPGTLEAYYQEAGRAGRDGLPGWCVLLHADDDRATHEWFIRGMFPDRRVVERLYQTLNASPGVGGGNLAMPGGRDAAAALRVLERVGAIARSPVNGRQVRVRLLATNERVARELSSPETAREAALLSYLREHGSERQPLGIEVNLNAMPAAFRGRTGRDLLGRLASRQFIHVLEPGGGIALTRPGAGIESFGIDWTALERRKAAELSKLDAMQAYTRARTCRRAFVLRYFGERATNARCIGCDNCRPA